MSFASRLSLSPSQVIYTVTNAVSGFSTGYSKGAFGTANTSMIWGVLEVTSFYTTDSGSGTAFLVLGFKKLDGTLPSTSDVQFANLIISSAPAPWPATYTKGSFTETTSGSERLYSLGELSPPYGNFGASSETFSLSVS